VELAAAALTVLYEGRAALREVSLQVAPGSRVAVCGGPGSGKTTLLKTLAALRRPDEGRILWDGVDPWTLPPEERRAQQARFGMVFQTDALFDAETVRQNVLLPLVRRGVARAEAERRADEALGAVGLHDAGALLPGQLSGGMQKRAGIARAVVARPAVLLADDPLAGLDPSTAAQVAALLLDASQGRTLLVAMPDPAPWLKAARWLVLDEGRLVQ
jgi:phospholipid/cholesterol/gamma-HCH transport system ATP-binding protein